MAGRRLTVVADRVVTLDPAGRVFAPGAVSISIQHGRIEAVGPADDAPADGVVERLVGQVLLPGLVNTHTHTPMWLFRGLTEDVPRGEWLTGRMRPLEDAARPEDLRAAAAAGCLELLLNGVTTIADRYGHMDAVADAVAASGLRAIVGHSVYDVGADAALAVTEGLLERFGTDPTRSRVTAGLAPHATDSCGPDLLGRVRALADRTAARVFIHLAQSAAEVAAVRARSGKGCAAYLEDLGLLAPEVVLAHATYLEAREAELVGRRRAAVAHCPSSNAKLEGRVAPVTALRAAGASVGLGTDAACCNNGMDLFEEMKLAALLNKVAADDPTALPVADVLRLATMDGARALGLDGLVGSLEVGKRADLVAVRTTSPRLQPWHDDAANLVYAVRGSDVRSVWVDGERLVRDGQPTRQDAAAVMAAAARAAERVRYAE